MSTVKISYQSFNLTETETKQIFRDTMTWLRKRFTRTFAHDADAAEAAYLRGIAHYLNSTRTHTELVADHEMAIATDDAERINRALETLCGFEAAFDQTRALVTKRLATVIAHRGRRTDEQAAKINEGIERFWSTRDLGARYARVSTDPFVALGWHACVEACDRLGTKEEN